MAERLSPQEQRAVLEKSYRDSYRKAQVPLTDGQIARQVMADLELVDGARRAGELGDGKPVKRDVVGPRDPSRPDPVAAAAQEAGLKLAGDRAPERKAVPYRPGVLYRNPTAVAERWGYAVARIGRIMEGAGGSSSLIGATNNATIPKLAREYLEVQAFYMTRAKAPPKGRQDHNPFRGLNDRDASRMFMRKCEDICDRSTGVLGSWYVK